MKTIKSQLIITSFRGLTDGSLSLTCHTPELQANEKVAFMELQGKNVEATLKPLDYVNTKELEVDKDLKQSRSKRLVKVFYAQYMKYKEIGKLETMTFNEYLDRKWDALIETEKEKIDTI